MRRRHNGLPSGRPQVFDEGPWLSRLMKRAADGTRSQESFAALDRLSEVVENGGNVFAELLSAVEVCSLGQITERLHEVAGVYRPTV